MEPRGGVFRATRWLRDGANDFIRWNDLSRLSLCSLLRDLSKAGRSTISSSLMHYARSSMRDFNAGTNSAVPASKL
jgi:hypothetical protein